MKLQELCTSIQEKAVEKHNINTAHGMFETKLFKCANIISYTLGHYKSWKNTL